MGPWRQSGNAASSSAPRQSALKTRVNHQKKKKNESQEKKRKEKTKTMERKRRHGRRRRRVSSVPDAGRRPSTPVNDSVGRGPGAGHGPTPPNSVARWR